MVSANFEKKKITSTKDPTVFLKKIQEQN